MKNKKKDHPILLAFLLAIICYLMSAKIGYAERTASEGGVASNNAGRQNYSTYGSTVDSYLYVNDNNTITRVELYRNEINYENYNSNLELISKGKLKNELILFGGFYSGKNANYFVYGQPNRKESKDCEVFRIVKYSKDWKRQGSCSLYDCNTTMPFDAGSLRFAECNDMLYIRTSHEMYTTYDGLNHQANLTLAVNTSSMEITDSFYDIMNIDYGYVSHSFNQFIKVYGNELLAVDHGDGYPRSVVLIKYSRPAGEALFRSYCRNIDLLNFPGEIGENETGGSVGGFEVSDSSYLVAGNYCNTGSYVRNIFLSVTPHGDFADGNTRLLYLTDYDKNSHIDVSTPHLVKINDGSFMVLWETTDTDTLEQEVNYVMVNGKGEDLSKIKKVRGHLSDCQPIVYNGKVMWYYTEKSSPIFCTIPADGADARDNLIIGDEIKDKNIIYSIISDTDKTKTVAVKGFVDTSVTSVTIPSTIKINGATYKVTEISDYAFESCFKLKTVVFGSNITRIGNACFTTNLKKIIIKSTKLKTIDKEAFIYLSNSVVIQVPKSKLNAYKKLINGYGRNFKIQIIN